MAKPDGRIEKGQRIASAISARAWNRAQDAADIVLGVRPGVEVEAGRLSQKPYTWVYCKPSVTVARWGILEITGVEVTPTSSDSDAATISFQDAPVITAGATSATTTAWCVAVEPIASGAIGRVAVSGVVQIKSSDFNKAVGAQLLWKNSNWALIQIGGGLRLGTISASWAKGATATVTEQNGDGSARTGSPTFTATNYFAAITVSSGTSRVACGKVDDRWILIAAECE
jgi:predicted RecA/RadA family phage recombinase